MRYGTRILIIPIFQSMDRVFANAILWPGPKKQITLRIDPDVLTFFESTAADTRAPSTRFCANIWKLERANGGRPAPQPENHHVAGR
jgi:hypothetical protein